MVVELYLAPRGDYWRDQGKSPCEDLGTIKFRTPNGTEISNTAAIARGYKSGYNVIQTAGEGFQGDGDGGAGATGGSGGDNGGAGGGGSGYTDGSVTVVDTQLGGSTEAAKVIIRIADPSTIDPSTTLEEVSFTLNKSRIDLFNIVVTFVKESGTGPDRIVFEPGIQLTGTVTASMGAGAVYVRESALSNGVPAIDVKLSDGKLEVFPVDFVYVSLEVTPNNGKFTSDSRYEFT